MKDYEILHIPNSQLPNIGLLHLTVSENRVGLRMTVLDALGRPDGIIIRRGIKANEGKLVVEAAEYDPDNYYDGVMAPMPTSSMTPLVTGSTRQPTGPSKPAS